MKTMNNKVETTRDIFPEVLNRDMIPAKVIKAASPKVLTTKMLLASMIGVEQSGDVGTRRLNFQKETIN
jgi:hypothetical protein